MSVILFYCSGNGPDIEVEEGPHESIINADNIWGNCTHIYGDASNLIGNITNVRGDVSGITGAVAIFSSFNATGLFGEVTGGDPQITEEVEVN
jgi:hypothetical protein